MENVLCALRYFKNEIFKLSSRSSVTVFPIKLSTGHFFRFNYDKAYNTGMLLINTLCKT